VKTRAFEDFAGLGASYIDSPGELMEKIRKGVTGLEISDVSKIDGQSENLVRKNGEKISAFLIKKKRRNIKILEGDQCP